MDRPKNTPVGPKQASSTSHLLLLSPLVPTSKKVTPKTSFAHLGYLLFVFESLGLVIVCF